MLLGVVAQSLKPVKLLSQQLSVFLLFRDCRSVLQQCWIRLRSSFNIVGVKHAHYPWSPWRSINVSQYCLLKTLMYQYYGIMRCKFQHYWELLHSFAPTANTIQQLPKFSGQQCWELLRPFARSLRHREHIKQLEAKKMLFSVSASDR